MKHEEILEKDKNYDVYKFCKENNIECSWDFSRRDATSWTEIYIDGDSIFQFEHSTTKKQFFDVVNKLKINFKDKCNDIEGDDFWWVVSGKKLFTKFINKHEGVFKTCT